MFKCMHLVPWYVTCLDWSLPYSPWHPRFFCKQLIVYLLSIKWNVHHTSRAVSFCTHPNGIVFDQAIEDVICGQERESVTICIIVMETKGSFPLNRVSIIFVLTRQSQGFQLLMLACIPWSTPITMVIGFRVPTLHQLSIALTSPRYLV